MSSATFLMFELSNPTRPDTREPMAIDPLAVATVNTGARRGCGAVVIMDSGTQFNLHDDFEGVVRAINDARTAYANARRARL